MTDIDVAGQAMQQGSEGLLEDTLAAVRPWGFQTDAIRVPVLVMHGANDKMVLCAHGQWLGQDLAHPAQAALLPLESRTARQGHPRPASQRDRRMKRLTATADRTRSRRTGWS
jgi:pimeloyl-ACP methyl ester carboxylesterase